MKTDTPGQRGLALPRLEGRVPSSGSTGASETGGFAQDRKTIKDITLGVLAMAALVVVLAALTWAFMMDDAYIGLRYLQNLLDGKGLVFNPGDRIEGITNIGWVIVLVGPALVLGPIMAAKIVGSLLLVASLAGTALLTVRLRLVAVTGLGTTGRALVALAPAAIAVCQPDYVLFSLIGMETALYSALLVGLALLVDRGGPSWAIAFAAVLLFLAHPEGAAVWVVFLVLVALSRAGLSRWSVATLLFVAGCVIATAARYLYFGDFVPNTAHVKGADIRALVSNVYSLLAGVKLVPLFFGGFGVLVLMAVGLMAVFKANRPLYAYLGAALLVGYSFALYAGPDWTGMARYFAPSIPLAAIVLWAGLAEAVRATAGSEHSRRIAAILLSVVSLIVCIQGARLATKLTTSFRSTYPGYVLLTTSLVEPARWMRENLPPNSIVATRRIGALSYHSGLSVFDFKYGLTDRDIARMDVGVLTMAADPKFGAVWKQRRPDYLLEDDFIVRKIIDSVHGSESSFTIHDARFRVMKRFPIGKDVSWLLCERF
jgi:hypothetical protein